MKHVTGGKVLPSTALTDDERLEFSFSHYGDVSNDRSSTPSSLWGSTLHADARTVYDLRYGHMHTLLRFKQQIDM